jgi:hypothetical protein
LISLHGTYASVSPMSSTDHLAILPTAFGLRMISPNENEEITVTGWASK